MSNDEFYKNKRFNGYKNIYLSNGANETLSNDGSGTTAAINKLSKKFFTNCINIYEPNKTDYRDIDTSNQTITYNGQEYLPGSVFLSDPNVHIIKNKITIKGVYHIKGWNFKNDKLHDKLHDETQNIPFVKNYYTKILEHFTLNNQNTILHLVQTPGELYDGTIITMNAMHDAIIEYIQANYNKLYSNNLLISVDIDKDEIEKYIASLELSQKKDRLADMKLESEQVKSAGNFKQKYIKYKTLYLKLKNDSFT